MNLIGEYKWIYSFIDYIHGCKVLVVLEFILLN